ncbi:hypothetical protein KJ966_26540 [bacterium]|nr:hypothetical protein [bacterium]
MTNTAKVYLNINSITKKISPMIFGSFIEHVGECIHDGIWSYGKTVLPLADHPELDKIRWDLLNAMINLRPALIRWPGGCYADVYHWKDAIGPRSTRKKLPNSFWSNWSEQLLSGISELPRSQFDADNTREFKRRISHDVHNQFGTLEFLTLCEEVLAIPYITVNYGSGTPGEAADWVEYCNGNPDSSFGELRTAHGRRSPFNVPIWGIGNEIYLENEQGYEKNPSDYGKRYMQFAQEMKKKDPSIKLVGCGWNQGDWNERFLKEVDSNYIDYLSIHQYLPFPADLNLLSESNHPDNELVYHAMMAAPFEIKKQILKAWNSIVRRFGERPRVRIAFDEWGIWYTLGDMVKANYNLQDGIFAGLVLMLFQRFSDICPIGLWSMLVNSLGMIRTDATGLILTPIYQVFKLFKDHTYNNLIENISVESDQFDSEEFGQVKKISGNPTIECSATCTDDGGKLALMLINKSISESVSVELRIKAFMFFKNGKIVEYTSSSPFDYNTEEEREKIEVSEKEISTINADMTLTLKPHSITILKMIKLDLGISI